MAELVARHGPCTLARPRPGRVPGEDRFAALCESILYQQLAGSAAAAIHRRFQAALGKDGVSPGGVLSAGIDVLRGAGLSGAKATAVTALAEAVASGQLDLDNLSRVPDDEIVARLSAVRGIGRWTAEMFCLFTLGRLDVWPVTDYGVRKGFANAYGLAELPTPRDLAARGEGFRPYRSVVAWYCWKEAQSMVRTAVVP